MKSVTLLFLALSLFIHPLQAQKMKKADKVTYNNLKTHISYLADDKLEGRRAGSEGEALASVYISGQFSRLGLKAAGENNSYLQPFPISDGKGVNPATLLTVNGTELKQGVDYFPLAYSPDAESGEVNVSPSIQESGTPWFKNLGDVMEQNKENPHFDLAGWIREETDKSAAKGAKALMLYNLSEKPDALKFDPKDKNTATKIPVFYIQKTAFAKYFKDTEASYDVRYKVSIGERSRTGHNVVAYLDKGAAQTVIIGAHYDHLGYGEDGNSMIRTGEKAIHNGADDNASGTAAMLELARILSSSKAKNYNFLFLAFSGEELGLYGSKYYTEHPTINFSTVNYMINLDMVGRMNDSSRAITIGGFGTSPTWGQVINVSDKKLPFNIKVDSSGSGPSDHTSFYRKDLPVLFFFTGLHGDYHRPSDDANKINYAATTQIINYINGLITSTSTLGKLAFTKTREQQTTTSARFSVSMGIMPDYTYSGTGVKVDGVSEGRAAQKAGIKAGDIVIKLGDYSINSMESYMQTLGKFKKGDTTRVVLKRGTEELTLPIQF